MFVLVVGTPDSGKSKLAEDIAITISAGERKIYLATMQVLDDDGIKRVEKHRKQRNGKGFETVEIPFDITDLIKSISDISGCTVLLECISNLAGNEMHKENVIITSDILNDLAFKIIEDIKAVADKASNMVVVTNRFSIEDNYDEETIMYIKLVDLVNNGLIAIADEVRYV